MTSKDKIDKNGRKQFNTKLKVDIQDQMNEMSRKLYGGRTMNILIESLVEQAYPLFKKGSPILKKPK